MNGTIRMAGIVCVCGLAGSVWAADFELKRQPLPGKGMDGLYRFGHSLMPMPDVPPGIEGVEARWSLYRFSQTDHRRILLVKSSVQQKEFDRLYVDTNADGRFDKGECYELSRSNGPVTVVKQEGRVPRFTIRPVKVVAKGATPGPPKWIILTGDLRGRNSYLSWTPATRMAGQVRFGDTEVQLAIYSPDSVLVGGFDRRVRLPSARPESARRPVQTGCHVLFDANGDGRFDSVNLSGAGPENQWLTRLLRLDGSYYELAVGEKGRSVRVTPARPKVGILKIPANVASASLVGPEFATSVSSQDGQVELPVGQYVVYQYTYRTPTGSLRAYDTQARAVLQVRPGQTQSLQLGPPLTLQISHAGVGDTRRGTGPLWTVRLNLAVVDSAGRQIYDVRTSKNQRPPAPAFKIVDPAGKIVHKGAFEYG